MYHSITFGEKNSWDDWYLISASRPIVPPRDVKIKTVDVPGANGVIDLTEVLTGDVLYGTSQATFDFIVENDHGNWVDRYNEIVNYLHGKRKRFVLEDEPDVYYEGRFSVSWKTGKDYSTVSMKCVVDVYREPVQTDDE